MKTFVRRILVAIRDLQHVPANQLRKAATLARASGASVELFHAIMEPDPARGYPQTITARATAQARALTAARCQQRLQKMAASAVYKGTRVNCTASWDFPPHEAIVRRVHATKAGLVVAATRPHIPGSGLLLAHTDWELIRECPAPVLLVKSRRPYKKPVVLAAVDPFHAHARPADLDPKLVATGAAFAKLFRGRLHVFHAFMPLSSVAAMPGAPPVMLPPSAEKAYENRISRSVEDLGVAAGVPSRRCHVCMGGVADELDSATQRTRADLVVMGAVSRSALKRLFIGNTAERVLDRLECDVLVVKPRGFKSKVTSRRAVLMTDYPSRRRMMTPRYRAPRLTQLPPRIAI
jgi:universal stress protein E